MKTRIGCLGLLLVWTLYGVYLTLTDGFSDVGGAACAVCGFGGLGIFLIWSAAESARRRRVQQIGYQADAPPRNDEA